MRGVGVAHDVGEPILWELVRPILVGCRCLTSRRSLGSVDDWLCCEVHRVVGRGEVEGAVWAFAMSHHGEHAPSYGSGLKKSSCQKSGGSRSSPTAGSEVSSPVSSLRWSMLPSWKPPVGRFEQGGDSEEAVFRVLVLETLSEWVFADFLSVDGYPGGVDECSEDWQAISADRSGMPHFDLLIDAHGAALDLFKRCKHFEEHLPRPGIERDPGIRADLVSLQLAHEPGETGVLGHRRI